MLPRSHRTLRRLLFDWFPLLLWMGWIYWISARPSTPHPGRKVGVSDDLFDYSAHAFTFGLLTILAWRALRRPPYGTSTAATWPIWCSATVAALYAISDEVHQSFVPGRWAKVEDWLADMAGVLLTSILLFAWQRWGPKLVLHWRGKHAR